MTWGGQVSQTAWQRPHGDFSRSKSLLRGQMEPWTCPTLLKWSWSLSRCTWPRESFKTWATDKGRSERLSRGPHPQGAYSSCEQVSKAIKEWGSFQQHAPDPFWAKVWSFTSIKLSKTKTPTKKKRSKRKKYIKKKTTEEQKEIPPN